MSAAYVAEQQPVRWPAGLGYLLAAAMVAAATVVALVVERAVAPPNLSLVFVLPVAIAAVGFGWGPALTAAFGGVAAYNYFLIEPRHTLRVAEASNVWALALLMVIAAMLSAVAAESRRRAMAAWEAAEQAATLQGLARTLVGADDRRGIADACADALSRLFHAPAAVYLETGDGIERAAAARGEPGPVDDEAAAWAMASRLPTRGGAYPIDGAAYDFWPVLTQRRQRAVIGVSFEGLEERPRAPDRLVETVGGHMAVALDRDAYAADALRIRVQSESARVRADLLAAVSHDLKTPLATVLLSLQSLLKFSDSHDAETRRELLESAEAEAARLNAMVANLLDVNRLEAGALAVRTEPVAPAKLAAEAARRAAPALAGRRLDLRVAADAARLLVDPALFECALANVLENAGKYTPAGSVVELRSGADDDRGWIEVIDEGAGFPVEVERLFEKFTRGVEGDGRPPGAGLGLAIARGFLEAQGGWVEAANRADGKGACVRLLAPLADAP